MKENKVVIVMRDPVKWMTACRLMGIEPNGSREEDATPFYFDIDSKKRNGSSFNKDEIAAIEKNNLTNKMILVKNESVDGTVKYVPLTDSDKVNNALKTLFEETRQLVVHFITLLGGNNIKVSYDLEDKEVVSTQCQTDINVGGKKGTASVDAHTTSNSEKVSSSDMSKTAYTEIARADSNFKEARNLLSKHKWLESVLSFTIDQVERCEIHGLYKQNVKIETIRTLKDNFDFAADVAAKFGCIDADAKAKIKKTCDKMVQHKETWEISMVFK